MDDYSDVFMVMMITLLLTGSLYGTYRLGRFLERRDLTEALVHQLDSMYWDGYNERVRQDMLYDKENNSL